MKQVTPYKIRLELATLATSGGPAFGALAGASDTYGYDGRSQVVSARRALGGAEVCVTYAYDHRGRMVKKDIMRSGSDPILIEYLWDGWNIIREVVRDGDSGAITDNIWGLDLDGTLQGAGGIGGLLAVVRDDGVFFPTYDANGNITEYVTTNGEIVAHYDYSPFGEPLVSSGPLASTFTHRFSTKPWCADTWLNEYQMRKYRPSIGRWMSRDPMEESGDINLVCAINNNAVMFHDTLGLLTWIASEGFSVEVGTCGIINLSEFLDIYDSGGTSLNGSIIQSISIKRDVYDCRTHDKLRINDPTDSSFVNYTEEIPRHVTDSWENNKSYASVDGCGSYGVIVWDAIAQFYEGYTPFLSGAQVPDRFDIDWDYSRIEDPKPWGGFLGFDGWFRNGFPGMKPTGIGLHRKLIATWNCCCDETETKWSYLKMSSHSIVP